MKNEKKKEKFSKAQGALEYLLIIAGAVIVAAVVIAMLGTMAPAQKEVIEKSVSTLEESQAVLMALRGAATENIVVRAQDISSGQCETEETARMIVALVEREGIDFTNLDEDARLNSLAGLKDAAQGFKEFSMTHTNEPPLDYSVRFSKDPEKQYNVVIAFLNDCWLDGGALGSRDLWIDGVSYGDAPVTFNWYHRDGRSALNILAYTLSQSYVTQWIYFEIGEPTLPT